MLDPMQFLHDLKKKIEIDEEIMNPRNEELYKMSYRTLENDNK
jgi:hypothetical protein